jgi:hypothetical protein
MNLPKGSRKVQMAKQRTRKAKPFLLPPGESACQCGGKRFTGVQYVGTTEDYDGVSEWQCNKCHRRYGRWTRRELLAGELERRYGGSGG